MSLLLSSHLQRHILCFLEIFNSTFFNYFIFITVSSCFMVLLSSRFSLRMLCLFKYWSILLVLLILFPYVLLGGIICWPLFIFFMLLLVYPKYLLICFLFVLTLCVWKSFGGGLREEDTGSNYRCSWMKGKGEIYAHCSVLGNFFLGLGLLCPS